jgi:uncharacterized protein
MSDLMVAFGLVLVIEGLIWAASPGFAASLLARAVETPAASLRMAGTVAIAAGVFVIWLVRG